MVAVFHFFDEPFEGSGDFFGAGYDGDEHVGEVVVKLHFDDFGVDHDEAKVIWASVVEEGGDDGVDADGFAGAGGACDEEVGHFSEVVDEGFAGDFFTEDDGDFGVGLGPGGGFYDIAEADGSGLGVRDFDADGAFSWDGGEDADGVGFEGEGDIFIEASDFFYAYACGGDDFVAGDDGAGVDFAGGDGYAEFCEGADEVIDDVLVF